MTQPLWKACGLFLLFVCRMTSLKSKPWLKGAGKKIRTIEVHLVCLDSHFSASDDDMDVWIVSALYLD